jgi:hypothetical protein
MGGMQLLLNQRSSKEQSRKSGGAGVNNEDSLKTSLQEYFTPDCYCPMRSANAGMMPFCVFWLGRRT